MKELIKKAFKLGYKQAIVKSAARDFDGMHDAAGRYRPSMEERYTYLHDRNGQRIRPLTNQEVNQMHANSTRLYTALASAVVPGGFAAAAALNGSGEAGASAIEGRPAGDIARRGAGAAVASGAAYLGGQAVNKFVMPTVRSVAGRFGAGKFVNRAKGMYDSYSTGRDVLSSASQATAPVVVR